MKWKLLELLTWDTSLVPLNLTLGVGGPLKFEVRLGGPLKFEVRGGGPLKYEVREGRDPEARPPP